MEELLAYIQSNSQRFLDELKEFLSIPSISSQKQHAGDIRKCAGWLCEHLISIGLADARIFETAGHPIVYGESLQDTKKPTILVYGHYDVQPVDPVNLWDSPPFEMTIRDGNIFARGATDDKGQLFVHLKAIETFMKALGSLPVNIKLLIEGEEEVGSVHLENFVSTHKDLLKANLVVISDSSMFAENVPSLCYGLRGLAYFEIELTGPNRDLHSGGFGGSVHNPIQALCELIASLHDKQGKIAIKGMYNDVRELKKEERNAFKKLPWSDKDYAKSLGVAELYGEKGFSSLERLWVRPTLDINGIWGGYTGEGAKTVLPSKAHAKISTRLVPDQKPEKIAKLVEQQLRANAPKTVKIKVKYLHGGEAAITALNSPGVVAASTALEKGFGKKPLFQREGGSIPIVAQFKQILGLDTVLLGFGLPDENAHAPNEFFSVKNFYGGIRTVVHFHNELPAVLAQTKSKKKKKR
jgi:acetylornithine deacetylase/succinyl-diaminopimelate desuccinylase-like protein